MAILKSDTEAFAGLGGNIPILDARSPSEYRHAHIPGAHSLPIFDDEERRIIGTAYKQESREKAIKLGLDFFGKKMVSMVEQAEKIAEKYNTREVAVHCWRGGMRSSAVAWLLDLYGFKVHLLSGGYKAYRKRVLSILEKPHTFIIVGGYTGGNKTGIIYELQRSGEKVIDLEGIAVHKGSAFGNLEEADQPSQEHFENLLAGELQKQSYDPERPIWLEGESQRLGNVNIPMTFFSQMRSSHLLFLDIPFECRLQHILKGYGAYKKEKLINAILRIKKRLGGLETKNAVNALIEDDVTTAFTILLKYYDRLYLKSTYSKEIAERKITHVISDTTDPVINLKKLKQHVS
jgi:tRNA 2-selenouridine synthase